jgi:hypothetical protein
MLRFFKEQKTRDGLRLIADADALTVIVGAGASTEAGLPSWQKLVDDLLDDALSQRGWSADADAIKTMARKNGLLTAAEIARALLDDDDDLGNKVKEHLYDGADPTSLHPGPLLVAIAALQNAFGRSMSIGTFNYDDLIEAALRARAAARRWWQNVRSYIQGRQPLWDDVGVTHLHGLLGREDKGRVVLTEGDYQIMQNSTSCWQEDWFIDRLRHSTCLFLGVSMSDPNLIRYLHRAPKTNRRHIALLRRDADLGEARLSAAACERCEEAERLRWARLGVTVLFTDNYADITQFVWEVVLRLEEGDQYRSLPQRLHTWWSREQAGGCLFASNDKGYASLQLALHDALVEILDDVRDLIAEGSVALSRTGPCQAPDCCALRSDRSGELRERGGDAPTDAGVNPEFVVAAPYVLHERVTSHDHARRVVTLEPAHRSQPGLEPAVVGFDPIVRVLRSVVKRGGEQLIDRHPQRPGPIGYDLAGLAVVAERRGEEPSRRVGVASG